jgi:SAM-dependent methyltransferase
MEKLNMPKRPPDWDERYAQQNTPWDTGHPSSELQRVLREREIPCGRALELGCGTGTNAIFLAQQGFDVTAVDISLRAIKQARVKADEAGGDITFRAADLLELSDLEPSFPLVFDRGVYHAVRREALTGFLDTLSHVTAPGGMYLTLAGNANETRPDEQGPPRVSAMELCCELAALMDLVQLREIRFDETVIDGKHECPLAWSALFRRKQPAT